MARKKQATSGNKVKVHKKELKGKGFGKKSFKKYAPLIGLGCVAFAIMFGISYALDPIDLDVGFDSEWAQEDIVNGMVVDSEGNIIITGGSKDSGGTQYILIAQLDATGAVVWEVHDDAGVSEDVALDSDDNPYIAYCNSTHVTIEKYDSKGDSDWKKTDMTATSALGVKIDSEDKIYLVGKTDTTTPIISYDTDGKYLNGFTYPKSFVSFDVDDDDNIYGVYSAGSGIGIVKVKSDGNEDWSKNWTLEDLGSYGHTPADIGVDGDGNTFVSGYYTAQSVSYAFIARFDDKGENDWQNAWEYENSYGGNLVVDEDGNVFMIRLGEDTTPRSGVMAAYDSDGKDLWGESKTLPWSSETGEFVICLDDKDSVYAACSAYGTSSSTYDIEICKTSTIYDSLQGFYLRILAIVVLSLCIGLLIGLTLISIHKLKKKEGERLKAVKLQEDQVAKDRAAREQREREEAQRKAAEELARQERERKEAERRMQEEAERKERERIEEERKAQLRNQKRAELKQQVVPIVENYLSSRDYSAAIKELEKLVQQAKSYDIKDLIEWAEAKLSLATMLDKLMGLLSISDNVNLNDVAGILEMDRPSLLRKLVEWGKLFEFKIDGDMLRIKSADVGNLLNLLDDSYKDWTSDKKKTMKKD